LSNGVRVVLKPTTFKQDEILFRAVSPGGTSLASDADFVTAETAATVISRGGLGQLTETALERALAGKNAFVEPQISDTDEGLRAAADIRAQLAWLAPAGFLLVTPWERLKEYPRYLQALEQRLEKLARDPRRQYRQERRHAAGAGPAGLRGLRAQSLRGCRLFRGDARGCPASLRAGGLVEARIRRSENCLACGL